MHYRHKSITSHYEKSTLVFMYICSGPPPHDVCGGGQWGVLSMTDAP